MTTRGFDKPLYIQPFDHRGSFQTKLFGWAGPLTAEQTAQISAAKQVIYDGFQAAVLAGVPKEKAGILVDEVGCIVLGRGEDDQKVREWLTTAASVPGFIGFAVGRTAFWEPLLGWRAKQTTRQAAVTEIARRYREFVDIFEKARGG